MRAHIAEHGGDPDLVAVSGGSAGERLTSLPALTPNRPQLQPGFADVDTSVQAAAPSQQVRADAPPFFVLQGTHDSLIFVQGGRAFVRRPVACAELRGSQHAFDLVHSIRTEFAVDAAHRFLEVC